MRPCLRREREFHGQEFLDHLYIGLQMGEYLL